MTVWYRLNTITRCRNSRNLFHNYVTLQENNYQLHSKNYALKIIAKGENKIKDCLAQVEYNYKDLTYQIKFKIISEHKDSQQQGVWDQTEHKKMSKVASRCPDACDESQKR